MFKAIFTLPQRTIGFLRDVIAELRLIDWMKPRDVVRNTGIIVAMVTLLVIYLSGMDRIVVAIRNIIFSIS